MPLYRPSAVLRLQVRVDEGRATQELLRRLEPLASDDTSAIGKVSSQVAADSLTEINVAARSISTLNKLDEVTGAGDPALRAELDRVLNEKRALTLIAQPTGQPDAISGKVNDGLSITIGSLPVSRCSIARASFRTGDKCSFQLEYFDAPFDPRMMRSAAVELSIDVISPEEHDAGMHGLRRADGSRYSVVEDFAGVTHSTRFLGFITKWNMKFGADSLTIYGEAQDVMCILRETPLPPDVEIDHDLPIEQGIKALLETFPALRGMFVAFGPVGSSTPGPAPAGAASRRKKIVKKGKKRIRRNAENTNVWDHITDVCVGIGCIPVIDGVVLRVDLARTLFGASPNVPRMIWGRNLSSLEFTRTMSSQKQPTVEVRSYAPELKRTLAARYPDPKKQGVQRLGDSTTPKKPAAAAALTAAQQKKAKVLAIEKGRVKTVEPITLAQYENLQRTGPNADYADEILADPQVKF